MNFIVKPSLQHIAVVKIVTILLSHEDIQYIILKFDCKECDGNDKCRKEVENKVLEKTKKLVLPNFLERKVLGVVKPILNEMILFKHYYASCLSQLNWNKIFKNMCWRSEGSVDKRKTVEEMIKDKELDITVRYELACTHCLETDISKLWYKLFEKGLSFKLEEIHLINVAILIHDWSECMKKAFKDNKLTSEHKISPNLIIRMPYKCTKATTEYVLKKLTPEERIVSMVKMAKNIAISSNHSRWDYEQQFAEVLIFLLSQMSEEQHMEMFQTESYTILKSLLYWPRQSLFLEAAERLWDFLPVHKYKMLIEFIIDKTATHHDYRYDKLFKEFWRQSPITYKKYFFENGGHLIFKLFQMKEEHYIEWIFKDATPEEKYKMLWNEARNIGIYLIENDERDLRKLFIRECIASANEMARLKERSDMKLQTSSSNSEEMKLNRFFKLLEEDIQVDVKRRKL